MLTVMCHILVSNRYYIRLVIKRVDKKLRSNESIASGVFPCGILYCFSWFCEVQTMLNNLNFTLFHMHYAAWENNVIKKRCSFGPTLSRIGETWTMSGETWAMPGRVGSHRVCMYRYVKIDTLHE